jgi:hypothetical protein
MRSRLEVEGVEEVGSRQKDSRNMRGFRRVHSSSFVVVAGPVSRLNLCKRLRPVCLHHPMDMYALCKDRSIDDCRIKVKELTQNLS